MRAAPVTLRRQAEETTKLDATAAANLKNLVYGG